MQKYENALSNKQTIVNDDTHMKPLGNVFNMTISFVVENLLILYFNFSKRRAYCTGMQLKLNLRIRGGGEGDIYIKKIFSVLKITIINTVIGTPMKIIHFNI